MSLTDRWNRELDQLKSQGRHRQLRPPLGYDFSSNDYLGYGARVFHGGPTLPRGGMASRLLRGDHPAWAAVEDQLRRWHDAEAALIFNTGYMANEGLLSAVIAPGDWVASDQSNHASLIDGLRLTKGTKYIYRHNDLAHLEDGLNQARLEPGGQRFIVTESLFSMEGDRAPLPDLADLAEKYDAQLIVDEAHSTGCFGPQGSGLVDDHGLRRRVLASMHTGGKALGVPGAYIIGSRLLKDYLVNRSRQLIFTTALPPQTAIWWKDAVTRVWHDDLARSRLHALAEVFRRSLSEHGIVCGGNHYIVPIQLGDDARAVTLAESLQAAGFDVRAIRPPTVPLGTARLRISIHADHEASTLGDLAEHLKRSLAGS